MHKIIALLLVALLGTSLTGCCGLFWDCRDGYHDGGYHGGDRDGGRDHDRDRDRDGGYHDGGGYHDDHR